MFFRDFIDTFLLEQRHRAANGQDAQYFHEDQLVVILMDLFIAGSETTRNTMTWACLFLIHHPDVNNLIV